MKANLFTLACLLCLPSVHLAQDYRFLSFDRSGLLTFWASDTNLYAGLQYKFSLSPSNAWVDASAPNWSFRVTNQTMTVSLPTNLLSAQALFVRFLCSTNFLPRPPNNLVEVYGGDRYTETEPDSWRMGYYPTEYGYRFLGAARSTATFFGSHDVYIVHTPFNNVARVDTVGFSDGSYFTPGGLITGNVADDGTFWGPPDGSFATVGSPNRRGYFVVDATALGLTSITVFIQ